MASSGADGTKSGSHGSKGVALRCSIFSLSAWGHRGHLPCCPVRDAAELEVVMRYCRARGPLLSTDQRLAAARLAAAQEPVWTLAQKEKPAAIETLRELVNIESGSRDKEGLDRLAARLGERLE